MKQAPLIKVPSAFAAYIKAYPGLLNHLTSPAEIIDKIDSRFYMIKFSMIRIFDEPSFGEGIWIDVKIE